MGAEAIPRAPKTAQEHEDDPRRPKTTQENPRTPRKPKYTKEKAKARKSLAFLGSVHHIVS